MATDDFTESFTSPETGKPVSGMRVVISDEMRIAAKALVKEFNESQLSDVQHKQSGMYRKEPVIINYHKLKIAFEAAVAKANPIFEPQPLHWQTQGGLATTAGMDKIDILNIKMAMTPPLNALLKEVAEAEGLPKYPTYDTKNLREMNRDERMARGGDWTRT